MERLKSARVDSELERFPPPPRRIRPSERSVSLKRHWERPSRTASLFDTSVSPDEAAKVRTFIRAQNPPPFKERKPLSKRIQSLILAGISTIVAWLAIWGNWTDIATDIFGP